MFSEDKIFKQAKFNKAKAEDCGFVARDNVFMAEKSFMSGDFKAVLTVDENGKLSGEVYDAASNEVYLPLRVENVAGYALKVRGEYEKLLEEIKQGCFISNLFAGKQANRLVNFIADAYGENPDFPWPKYNNYGVFRNKDTGKWYALIMDITRNKLEAGADNSVEVLNIKLNNDKIADLLQQKGFYPAYHMNKQNWITITLDETLEDKRIFDLLDESRSFTLKKSNRRTR